MAATSPGQSDGNGRANPTGGRRLPGRHPDTPGTTTAAADPGAPPGPPQRQSSLQARAGATRDQASEWETLLDDEPPTRSNTGPAERGRPADQRRQDQRTRRKPDMPSDRRSRRPNEPGPRPSLGSRVWTFLTKRRDGSQPQAGQSSGGGRGGLSDATMARLGATLLWILVIVAAYGGVTAWLSSGSAAPDPAAAATTDPADGRWAAAGFAERYLTAYLSAGSDGALLTPYLGYSPDLPPLAEPTELDSPVRTVDVSTGGEASDEYWSVTLAVGDPRPAETPSFDDLSTQTAETATAADSDSANDTEGTPPAGEDAAGVATDEQFWQVAVDTSEDQPVAVGLPARVPPPAAPERASHGLSLSRPPPDDPMVESVEGFLAAYLCGAPDLDRYVHPDYPGADDTETGLVAADPAVCDTATVERWAAEAAADEATPDDDRHTVLAEVTFDEGSEARRATYGLTLARRDGRWEVAALMAAPPREER